MLESPLSCLPWPRPPWTCRSWARDCCCRGSGCWGNPEWGNKSRTRKMVVMGRPWGSRSSRWWSRSSRSSCRCRSRRRSGGPRLGWTARSGGKVYRDNFSEFNEIEEGCHSAFWKVLFMVPYRHFKSQKQYFCLSLKSLFNIISKFREVAPSMVAVVGQSCVSTQTWKVALEFQPYVDICIP